jgi:hypothetical protein
VPGPLPRRLHTCRNRGTAEQTPRPIGGGDRETGSGGKTTSRSPAVSCQHINREAAARGQKKSRNRGEVGFARVSLPVAGRWMDRWMGN